MNSCQNGEYFDCVCSSLTVQIVQCSTEGICHERVDRAGAQGCGDGFVRTKL